MPLFLLEFAEGPWQPERVRSLLDGLARAVTLSGGEIVESQVATDLGLLYVVVQHADRDALAAATGSLPAPPRDIAAVQLVGSTVEAVKDGSSAGSHLVEWDLPETLTMDRYLERKRQNSVRYAEVPEVQFLRTYVREDMEKCLCLYDAPDEECVRRARDAVGAPVDRLTRIERPE